MRALTVVVLLVSSLSLLAFGAAIAYAPLAVLEKVDVLAGSAAGSVELRAFYGGLELALGALILLCALRRDRHRDGLWLTLFVYSGIGLARAAGMLVEDVTTSFLRIALGVEMALALLAAACLYLTRSRGA